MRNLIYCPHCRSTTVMKIVGGNHQVDERRICYERVRQCENCGRKFVTVEVLSDLLYDYDHLKKQLEEIAHNMSVG